MKKVGLDPANIKYVIVSHGHRDHVGGARLLQERFGARVIMSAADWEPVANTAGSWSKPTRDMVATDGQRLTLGDTTVTARSGRSKPTTCTAGLPGCAAAIDPASACTSSGSRSVLRWCSRPPARPALCGVVAQSPFASLREIGFDRIGQQAHIGSWAGRSVLRPGLELAFLYARFRYGVDLNDASALASVARPGAPILLIHGMTTTTCRDDMRSYSRPRIPSASRSGSSPARRMTPSDRQLARSIPCA